MASVTGRATRFLLRELIGELVRFPVWWYSTGVVLAWRRLERQWLGMVDRLGLRFLLINMGRPMYGDYTRSGRVISFFFRLFLVGWSILVLAIWSVVVAVIFLFWLILPALAGGLFVRQLLP